MVACWPAADFACSPACNKLEVQPPVRNAVQPAPFPAKARSQNRQNCSCPAPCTNRSTQEVF